MAEGQRRFFPEQRNRQPLRGRVDLAVSAPTTRPDAVIAPERPTAPTLPRPDRAQPAPKPKPEKQKHTGRNIALGVTALGALGAGAYETYQNIPAIHQAVDSAFLDHLKGKSLSSEASIKNEVFDPTADKQVIKAGVNAVPINPEEIGSLKQKDKIAKPIINSEGDFPIVPEISALFPVKLKDQAYAEITTNYGQSFKNPKTGERMPQFLSYKEIALFNAKGTEVSAGMLYGIGTVKTIMVFRNSLYSSQENVPALLPYLNNITVRFTTEEGPVYDVEIQSSDNDIRQLVPLDIVKNAPVLPRKQSSQGHPMEWTQEDSARQGTFIHPDTSLLKANYDDLHIWYSVTAIFPDKPIGQQFNSVGDVKWSTDNNNKLSYLNK